MTITKAQLRAAVLGLRAAGHGLLQAADALDGASVRKQQRREPPEVEGDVDPALARRVARELRIAGRKAG